MAKYSRKRYGKTAYKKKSAYKKKTIYKKRLYRKLSKYSSEVKNVRITVNLPLIVYNRGGALYTSFQVKAFSTNTTTLGDADRANYDGHAEWISNYNRYKFVKPVGCKIKYIPGLPDQSDPVPRAPMNCCWDNNPDEADFQDIANVLPYFAIGDYIANTAHPRIFAINKYFKTYFNVARYLKQAMGYNKFSLDNPGNPPAYRLKLIGDVINYKWMTNEMPLGPAGIGAVYAAGEQVGRFEVSWYFKFMGPKLV